MILVIDASDSSIVKLALSDGKKYFTHNFESQKDLSERLTTEVKKFLKKQKANLSDIKKIGVQAGPGHFSRIRTAVATANALAFGLKIKVINLPVGWEPDISSYIKMTGQDWVKPKYDKAPNITKSKPHKYVG